MKIYNSLMQLKPSLILYCLVSFIVIYPSILNASPKFEDFKHRMVKITVSISKQFLQTESTGLVISIDNDLVYIITTLSAFVGDNIDRREEYYDALAEEKAEILVHIVDYDELHTFRAKFFQFEETLDLAVIKVSSAFLASSFSKKVITVALERHIKEGDAVYSISHSSDMRLRTHLSRIIDIKFPEIVFSNNLDPGAAGGVLVNNDHQLIGIITRKGIHDIAVNMDVVLGLLKEWDVSSNFKIKKNRKWLWIASSVGILGGITNVIIIRSFDNPNDGFPLPPGRPERN